MRTNDDNAATLMTVTICKIFLSFRKHELKEHWIDDIYFKKRLKWLTVAMPLRERLGRNERETREREERTIDRLQKDQQETRYGAMADGLS